MSHPFDRYSTITDLHALKEWSEKPLRKSIRINTLKTDSAAFQKRAADRGWQLTSVPWCPEGFFIERENREEALGRDLLHLAGFFYIQEAASMLPAALLDPQPGESVLDMSAAPGSKTTQMTAAMRGRGVVLANDVQEKRLWTLKSALHRAGATNVIVTKKVGQWFARHMTERFDRVLCDAPCTAQGTARKDSEALQYCSMDNVRKMSGLQVALLASAIHCAKVGGRIVYSTCTLTPEENEGVVLEILRMFEGKVEVIHPAEAMQHATCNMQHAIDDSAAVQDWLRQHGHDPVSNTHYPLVRLWPQTYDTEGFFSAVLRKTASTRDSDPMRRVRFQEADVSRQQADGFVQLLMHRYGTTFKHEGERLYRRGELLLLASDAVSTFEMPLEDYALGLPFAKVLRDGRLLLDHETASLRGGEATAGVWDADWNSVEALLKAKDTDCPPELDGPIIVRFDGIVLGMGLAKNGRLKNNLPRWMVRFG